MDKAHLALLAVHEVHMSREEEKIVTWQHDYGAVESITL